MKKYVIRLVFERRIRVWAVEVLSLEIARVTPSVGHNYSNPHSGERRFAQRDSVIEPRISTPSSKALSTSEMFNNGFNLSTYFFAQSAPRFLSTDNQIRHILTEADTDRMAWASRRGHPAKWGTTWGKNFENNYSIDLYRILELPAANFKQRLSDFVHQSSPKFRNSSSVDKVRSMPCSWSNCRGGDIRERLWSSQEGGQVRCHWREMNIQDESRIKASMDKEEDLHWDARYAEQAIPVVSGALSWCQTYFTACIWG